MLMQLLNLMAALIAIPTGNLLTHRHQLVGWWTNGHSAGGSRNSSSYGSNPKFWLKVCDSGEVVVSLFQHRKCRNVEKPSQMPIEDRKKPKHQRYQAIALHMWQVWAFICMLRNILLYIFSRHAFLFPGGEKAL